MPIYITDADAFEKIAQVEGAKWAQYSITQQRLGSPARESFFHVQQVYCAAVCELKKYGEEDPVAGHATELMDNNVIYGDAGYARYIVRDDGEIVLDGHSTRAERVQKAQEAGIRVV